MNRSPRSLRQLLRTALPMALNHTLLLDALQSALQCRLWQFCARPPILPGHAIVAVVFAVGIHQKSYGQCNYRDTVLADNPVAYWRLGETSGTVATDEVGGGVSGSHPGGYVGTPTLGQPGAIVGDLDGCMFLTGNGSHMAVSDSPPLNFSGGPYGAPFSLEAWVKKSVPFGTCSGACIRRVIDKSHAGVPGGYGLDMNDDSIRILGTVNTGPGIGSVNGLPFATTTDTWYHFVAVSDGEGHGTIYVNGAEIGSDEYSSSSPWNTNLRIGVPDNVATSTLARFVGWIDEVAIYDHVLSHVSIISHYNAGLSRLEIFSHPLARSTCPTASAAFSVTAAGSEPFMYQWRHGGVPIDAIINPSAATSMLAITNVQPFDAGSYDCIVSNACGSVTSDPATLDVYCSCPGVSSLAGSVDAFAGPSDPASPSAALVGALTHPTIDFDEIPGVSGVPSERNCAHTFVGLPAGFTQATLTFVVRAGTVSITQTDMLRLGFTTDPGSLNIAYARELGDLAGVPWTYNTEASITLDLAALPMADGSTFNLLPELGAHGFLDFIVSDDSGVDYVQLTGVTSDGTTVVYVASNPESRNVCAGDAASFMVTAGGTPPYTYQWRKDGIDLLGATSDTLTITPATRVDAGSYDCVVSNVCYTVTSASAVLSVDEVPGDLNEDGSVNLTDLSTLLSQFGSVGSNLSADINGDGMVDLTDLSTLLSAFGSTC